MLSEIITELQDFIARRWPEGNKPFRENVGRERTHLPCIIRPRKAVEILLSEITTELQDAQKLISLSEKMWVGRGYTCPV